MIADFESLNHRRSETLRQLREMVSEEAALWARYFNGQDTTGIVTGIAANRERFRMLWDQHEEVRRQMAAAGFMPPPGESDELVAPPMDDPSRHEIENALKTEMEAARAEYNSASQEFRIFTSLGTGLPAPDGNLRARQIATLHSTALRKYTSAIRRFNAFLTDGKLPGE